MLPLREQQLILTEGSVFELLRREEGIELDAEIAHASLVYGGASRLRLAAVHEGYLRIAERHGLAAIAWADTWRASGERIARSRFAGLDVNGENVRFIREIAAQRSGEVIVGALSGPRGDAYDPREAPSFDDALRYHEPQIAALASSGADLLVAATLPAFEEARALARLLAESGVPFMISVVVRPDGTMLDGTPLATAIRRIDDESAPTGFSINCTHSSTTGAALRRLDDETARRVIAFQANTSARAPEDLDGLGQLETEAPEAFAAALAELTRTSSIRIVGGCCGTDERHIEALAARLVRAAGAA